MRRKPYLFLATAIISIFASISVFASQGKPDAAIMAPNILLQKLDGSQVSLSDYRGRWVFLNFWATWCQPCLAEMPAMETLYKKLKGKNFAMLAVSTDRGGASKVTSFIKEKGYSFEVFHDPEGVAMSKFGIDSHPYTYIINPEGEVVSQAEGARNWTDPEIIKYFKSLMATKGKREKR